ncbi:MAG: hypothetical protein AAF611_20915 [Bacteroidota bacterium]
MILLLINISPIIWSALIAAFVSIIVSIISIKGSLILEKRKFYIQLAFKEQEYKINALGDGIEIIQTIKNELRTIVFNLNNNLKFSIKSSIDQIDFYQTQYEKLYSKNSRYISKVENNFLHNLMYILRDVKNTCSEFNNEKKVRKNEKEKLIQAIQKYTELLSDEQLKLKQLRNQFIEYLK